MTHPHIQDHERMRFQEWQHREESRFAALVDRANELADRVARTQNIHQANTALECAQISATHFWHELGVQASVARASDDIETDSVLAECVLSFLLGLEDAR